MSCDVMHFTCLSVPSQALEMKRLLDETPTSHIPHHIMPQKFADAIFNNIA